MTKPYMRKQGGVPALPNDYEIKLLFSWRSDKGKKQMPISTI